LAGVCIFGIDRLVGGSGRGAAVGIVAMFDAAAIVCAEEEAMVRVYLSGPMTGMPEFNYPAFHEAARSLRAVGFEVVSPAEKPMEAHAPWVAHMRLDIELMLACAGVVMLPGWEQSKGARIERRLALELDMPVADIATVLRFQAQRDDCDSCANAGRRIPTITDPVRDAGLPM
jgi:hypothetical protein